MTIRKKIENNSCRCKSYLLVLFLFIIAASISFAQNSSIKYEILKRTTDQIEFKVSSENEGRGVIIILRESNIAPVSPGIELTYKPSLDYSMINEDSKTGENNMVIFQGALTSEQFIVSNLEHNTDYAIDTYIIKDSIISNDPYKVSTLALEPAKQIEKIKNSVPEKNSMLVLYKKGDGEKSYLLIGEGIEPSLPVDGISYNTTNDLHNTSKIDAHTFIISSENSKRFNINNLKDATTYYLLAIEANGENDKVNYLNTIENNKATVTTQPNPPINLMVTTDRGKRLKLHWEKPDNVKNYELDVAKDDLFSNKLSNFNAIRFGDTDKFIIVGIEKNTDYYIRMRSINENGFSKYSETIIGKIE